jgi:hypothetical protein
MATLSGVGRKLRRLALRTAVLGLTFGVLWTILFAWQTGEPFLRILPFGLVGGALFGLLMAIMIALFEHYSGGEAKLGFGWLRAKEPPVAVDAQTPYRARGERAPHVDGRVACPWCGERAMSRARKAWLGPALTLRCVSCKQPVSISRRAMLAQLPFLGSLAAAYLLASYAFEWILLSIPLVVLGGVLMFVLHGRVPLVRR